MNAKERLKNHYERKYEGEKHSSKIDVIQGNLFPHNRFEACLKFFPSLLKGGDILELGAGSGNVANGLISSGLEFNTYTLSDVTDSRLKGLLRKFDDPRIRMMKLDADSISNDGIGQFDAIIMIALIEHLIDPIHSMRQIKRLLKPNGFIYIDTPNIAKFTRRLKLLMGYFPATASKDEGLITYDDKPSDLYDEGHLHYFTYRSLSLMLSERCGFRKIEKFGYVCGWRLLGSRLDYALSEFWPEMFSETVVVAYV